MRPDVNTHTWRLVSSVAVLVWLLTLSGQAVAGLWGSQNWGELYWGDDEVSAPVVSPSLISISAQGQQLVLSLTSLQAGEDGWSTITAYVADCDNGLVVRARGPRLQLPSAVQDPPLQCQLYAENAFGQSAPLSVTLDAETLAAFEPEPLPVPVNPAWALVLMALLTWLLAHRFVSTRVHQAGLQA